MLVFESFLVLSHDIFDSYISASVAYSANRARYWGPSSVGFNTDVFPTLRSTPWNVKFQNPEELCDTAV